MVDMANTVVRLVDTGMETCPNLGWNDPQEAATIRRPIEEEPNYVRRATS